MKSASDWEQQIANAVNNQGGFDTPDEVEAFIKQIQLDAWKQGMTDAAAIASDHYKQHCCDDCIIRQAILTKRDNTTSL